MSYNILTGGTNRVDELTEVIRSCQPDIVGLVEAIDDEVVEKLAKNLQMEYRLSGRAKEKDIWQGAVLSRLPIVSTRVFSNEIIRKQPLLEVCVAEPGGEHLTVFVIHQSTRFGKLWLANAIRRRECRELLRIMAEQRGTKHLLMGDFNSIAPGEQMRGSTFVRYVSDPDLYLQLKPDPSVQVPSLQFVLPRSLRALKPLLEMIPKSRVLSALLDACSFLYAPRGGFRALNRAGYVDCFRSANPGQKGFTWPAPMPGARVDFLYASPELAPSLSAAHTLTSAEQPLVMRGSDHMPVYADFIS